MKLLKGCYCHTLVKMPRKTSAKQAPGKLVSLRHVAESLGVSRMTVSRAFQKNASIKPALREKILTEAKKMGYEPDRMVSELMTNFAGRRPVNYKETFAAIWWPERWKNVNRSKSFEAEIYQGLNEGAKLHGRSVDHFTLSQRMTAPVIERMLHARNIQGIILTPPATADSTAPEFNWTEWSTVSLGSSLREPNFHRAQASHYYAMVQTLEILNERQYKCPCLLVRSDVETRMRRAYTAAFLAWGYPQEHIWHATTPTAEGLSLWLKQIKPDVIIADWDSWYDYVAPQSHACGFTSLAVRDKEGSISGIHQNNSRIAKCAIDLLIRARLSNERGEPKEPVTTLTSGTWVEGSTLHR